MIKADKFHNTAALKHRIEFKGLITTPRVLHNNRNRSHRREIFVKSEVNSISTLKRIDERNGWFNRHKDKGGLKVYYQRIKSPINEAIGETFKSENAKVLRSSLVPITRWRSRHLPATKFSKNTQQRAHKTKTDHAHRQEVTTNFTHLHLVSEQKRY